MERHGIPVELRAQIENFTKTADEILENFRKTVDATAIPERIYHYTTGDGLRGILESGQFRMTNVFNLNDPSELRHGYRIAADVLDKKVEGRHQNQLHFAKVFRDFERTGIEASSQIFVTCFSNAPDDLSQWRAYADDGRGYILGFDAKCLEKAFCAADPAHAASFPINYNESDLVKLDSAVMEKICDFLDFPHELPHPPEATIAYVRALHARLTIYPVLFSLYFKHSSYENEREYRFMRLHGATKPVEDIRRRYRPYEVVKYVEFDWKQHCPQALKSIRVGPAAQQSKGKRFAEDCLEVFGDKNDVTIDVSEIPYRSA